MVSALGMGMICPFSSLDAGLFFSSQDLFLTFLPAGLDHPSISTKNTATVLRVFFFFFIILRISQKENVWVILNWMFQVFEKVASLFIGHHLFHKHPI